MKLLDFINKLIQDADGENLNIQFESYEWQDDLEDMEYQERYYDGVERTGDILTIRISR